MADKTKVEELNPFVFLFCRGDVVQVDTWVCTSGKNGMRRDWLVRDCKTGETLTRASRYWFPCQQVILVYSFLFSILLVVVCAKKKEREKMNTD